MSYLATLKYEDGYYIDASGCHFETWEDALGDVLGFCCCGRPEEALGYVLRTLRAVDLKGPEAYDAHSAWYHGTYRPALDAIFRGDSGAEYFAFYLLSDKKLLEHGGSVPGWLTDLGKGVLADLEAHADELLPSA